MPPPTALSAAAALRRSQQQHTAPSHHHHQQQQGKGATRQSSQQSSAKRAGQPQPPLAGPSRLAHQITDEPSASKMTRSESKSSATRHILSTRNGTASEEDVRGSTSSGDDRDFDDAGDEDEEEQEMALQMDGQDLWTQNYCSVCDCLIEPGQGVGPSSKTSVPAIKPPATTSSRFVDEEPLLSLLPPRLVRKDSSAASSTSSGLQSNASTIKASRPTSAEGKLKRNGSSGKLATGPLRRNGSAASRLNALSDLKPTTKLNADVTKPPKATTSTGTTAAGGAKMSPKANRRNSSASNASAGTAASEVDSLHSQPSPRSSLPRTKKGGLLGGLTPAALKQQQEEEEASRAIAPTALYCSERCRDIDQQTSLADLAEFHFFAEQQQQIAPISPTWVPDSPTYPRGSMRPSSLSSPRGFVPSSRSYDMGVGKSCNCQECQERNSASGTVPSGASDTTEGSGGNPYARMGAAAYRKQRTTSGRIITPQNLISPSGAEDSYFPRYADSRRHQSVSSTNTRNDISAAVREDTHLDDTRPPHRTASVASGETARSGTGSSAQSSGGYADFWEPALRSSRNVKSRAPKDGDAGLTRAGRAEDRASLQDKAASSTRSDKSQDITQEAGDFARGERGAAPAAIAGSLPAGASPLRFLRQSNANDRRASASVDISADFAQSPAYPRTYLGESFTSEQTLGTSAKTLIQREPSLRERRKGKGKSLLLDVTDGHNRKASPEEAKTRPDVDVNPAECLSKSYSGSGIAALHALKAAAAGAGALAPPSVAASLRPSPDHDHSDEELTSSRRHSSGIHLLSSASSGFLKGLSSAWTAFRGVPQGNTPPTLVVPDDSSASIGANGARRRSASQLSSASGYAILSPGSESERGRSSVTSDKSNNTGLLSKSAASESLSRMLSNSQLSKSYRDDSTAGVARPGPSRGSVPAFAREIGQGQIPGEAAPPVQFSSPPGAGASPASQHSYPRRNSSALGLTMTGGTEEEKRRRRKAELRHQRSKDITMLPPLLGPSNRASSSVNLAQQRSRSRSRSTVPAAGHGATFTVGSMGSYHDAHRPQTPSLLTARAREGARSPEISLNGGGPVAHDDQDYTPLPRMPSQQDLYRAGTSPRKSGLGWGGMTPITPHAAHPPTFHQHHPQPQRQGLRLTHHTSGPPVSRGGLVLGNVGTLGHHPHGSQAVYGRHNTMPVRTTTPIVPEHGGEMSGAALTGQDVSTFYREAAALSGSGVHSRPHSAMSNRRGSFNPAAAHHVTSASTTSLAQQGGGTRPKSWVGHRNSYGSTGLVPPSPIRNQFEPLPERNLSYDSLAAASAHYKSSAASSGANGGTAAGGSGPMAAGGGVKTYSVLTVPGREETHDLYDDTWNHVVEMLSGGTTTTTSSTRNGNGVAGRKATGGAEKATHATAAHEGLHGPPRRKQLFHFGS